MADSTQNLIDELKEKLVDILNFEDLTPGDIDEDEQMVGGSLGIDSIDILEMVIMIENDYKVIINNKELGEKVFVSLRTLAEYIRKMSPELAN